MKMKQSGWVLYVSLVSHGIGEYPPKRFVPERMTVIVGPLLSHHLWYSVAENPSLVSVNNRIWKGGGKTHTEDL